MALRRTQTCIRNRALFLKPLVFKLHFSLQACCPGDKKEHLPSSPKGDDAGYIKWPSSLSQGVNFPLIYSPNSVTPRGDVVERPFIFRNQKKKKKRKSSKSSSASKKAELTQVEREDALSVSEDESITVHEAIRIYNEISPDEKSSDKISSLKLKERSSADLIKELRDTNSHILGLSDAELNRRYSFLHSHGLSKMDSFKSALVFPSFLNLDAKNFDKFIELFIQYQIDVSRMIQHCPFVFSLDYSDVMKKLEHLGSIGLKKKDVSDIVNKNPIFLCYEVNHTAKSALKFATGFPGWKSSAGKSSFIESLLKTSLGALSTKYEIDENFTSVASFAVELHVPVSEIFKKCPSLFSTSKEQIYRTVHFLGNAPFFFDTEDMANFIQKYPDIFLCLDKEDVRDKILKIYKVLGEAAELHNILHHSPKMIVESTCVEKRIKLFQTWGFTKEQIGALMNRYPILFMENRVVENLEERLQFVLGHRDIEVADVMKFPACLQMRILMLKCKIGFVRSFAPDALKKFTLQEIFTAKDNMFTSDICSSSLGVFYLYLKENFKDTDQEWIKKKGRPKVNTQL